MCTYLTAGVFSFSPCINLTREGKADPGRSRVTSKQPGEGMLGVALRKSNMEATSRSPSSVCRVALDSLKGRRVCRNRSGLRQLRSV